MNFIYCQPAAPVISAQAGNNVRRNNPEKLRVTNYVGAHPCVCPYKGKPQLAIVKVN
jgi:hypothetical protein